MAYNLLLDNNVIWQHNINRIGGNVMIKDVLKIFERLAGKLQNFATVLENDQLDRLKRAGWNCQGNIEECKVKIKPGKKYVKVDVGTSGKYMVDADGQIWGIKAYGVIHRGHYYGTLDTINHYYWGEYHAYKK